MVKYSDIKADVLTKSKTLTVTDNIFITINIIVSQVLLQMLYKNLVRYIKLFFSYTNEKTGS